MVTYDEIRASNKLINDANCPRVAVFVGGTAGIGKWTIKALVATGGSTRIYLVGRKNSAERMHEFIEELKSINSKAQVIWTEGEISLLAATKRICDTIKAKERHIDLLFLSAGYAPFGTRQETSEGIEVCQSLEYYSRMLFILRLMPLLEAAGASRVVNVLGGGLERVGALNADDIDLKKAGNFSGIKAQQQYTVLNSITLDRLAMVHPDVIFIHSWPGWANTGNVRRGGDPNSLWSWFVWLFLDPLINFVGNGEDVTAQRHLFQSTSAYYGGRGITWEGRAGVTTTEKSEGGLFLVNYKCDCTPNAKPLRALREQSQETVWSHTQDILRPYLT